MYARVEENPNLDAYVEDREVKMVYKVKYQLRNRQAVYRLCNFTSNKPVSISHALELARRFEIKDARLICVSAVKE